MIADPVRDVRKNAGGRACACVTAAGCLLLLAAVPGVARDTAPVPAPAGRTLAAETSEGGSLTLRITGLRNDRGDIRVALFTSPEGFPGRSHKADRKRITPARTPETVVVFPDLPPGTYAASVTHDENANQRMDTNWLGMPAEGVGASNDAQGFMGPPSFEDARFRHGKDAQVLAVTLQYL